MTNRCWFLTADTALTAVGGVCRQHGDRFPESRTDVVGRWWILFVTGHRPVTLSMYVDVMSRHERCLSRCVLLASEGKGKKEKGFRPYRRTLGPDAARWWPRRAGLQESLCVQAPEQHRMSRTSNVELLTVEAGSRAGYGCDFGLFDYCSFLRIPLASLRGLFFLTQYPQGLVPVVSLIDACCMPPPTSPLFAHLLPKNRCVERFLGGAEWSTTLPASRESDDIGPLTHNLLQHQI